MRRSYQTATRYVTPEEMLQSMEEHVHLLELKKARLTRELTQVEQDLQYRLKRLEDYRKQQEQQEERKQLLAAQGFLPDSPVAREPNR